MVLNDARQKNCLLAVKPNVCAIRMEDRLQITLKRDAEEDHKPLSFET